MLCFFAWASSSTNPQKLNAMEKMSNSDEGELQPNLLGYYFT